MSHPSTELDPTIDGVELPAVSVVAPVHDEVENLEPLVRQIHQALDGAAGEGLANHEIVLVDDASSDGSRQLLSELTRSDPRLRARYLPRRSGQSAALLCAIREARGGVVVTIDSDLQNDPADIPRLLERMADGYDLVSGVRARRRDSWLRRVASGFANRVRRAVLRDPFHDSGCALKAYRAELLRDLPAFDGAHRFLPVLALHRLGDSRRVCEVTVNHRPRRAGDSSYSAIRGRALRGVHDLVGVRWLLRRRLDLQPQESVPSRPCPGADRARPGEEATPRQPASEAPAAGAFTSPARSSGR